MHHPFIVILALLSACASVPKAPDLASAGVVDLTYAFEEHTLSATVRGAQVPGLENLANLERLPATGAWIIALPMKIGGGSGGPLARGRAAAEVTPCR